MNAKALQCASRCWRIFNSIIVWIILLAFCVGAWIFTVRAFGEEVYPVATKEDIEVRGYKPGARPGMPMGDDGRLETICHNKLIVRIDKWDDTIWYKDLFILRDNKTNTEYLFLAQELKSGMLSIEFIDKIEGREKSFTLEEQCP